MPASGKNANQDGLSFLPGLVKVVGVTSLAAIFVWFSIVFTFAMMGASATARSFVPLWIASNVEAATASTILQSGSPTAAELTIARSLGQSVIKRDPTNVSAVRSLGTLAALSDPFNAKAARLFTYAETLSRRDLPTQLWLIERNVAANDIPGALVHYDRALRTNVAARDLLIPILVEAAKQPAVADSLAKIIAHRPLWWAEFMDKFIYAADAPQSLELIAAQLRLNKKNDGERNLLIQTMMSLVEGNAPQRAYDLFKQADGSNPSGVNFVRDGGFDNSGGLPPFDWSFVDEADLSAVRERRTEGIAAWVLSMVAQNGRGGIAAQQLLMLPAGLYRLSGRGGDMPEDLIATPKIVLTCTGKGGVPLVVARYPTGQAHAAVDTTFTVPTTGCPAVWLILSREAPVNREAVTPWVDAITVRRS